MADMACTLLKSTTVHINHNRKALRHLALGIVWQCRYSEVQTRKFIVLPTLLSRKISTYRIRRLGNLGAGVAIFGKIALHPTVVTIWYSRKQLALLESCRYRGVRNRAEMYDWCSDLCTVEMFLIDKTSGDGTQPGMQQRPLLDN